MNEKIYIINKRNQKLCGNIYLPENVQKVPFVVLVHGFTSNKECHTNLALIDKLNSLGIGTLAFDLMGHGESKEQFKEITTVKSVEDLECVFEYLGKYENIDFNNIALFGRSFGGNIVLQYFSRHNNVKAIALNSPCSQFEKTPIFQISNEYLSKWKSDGCINGLFGEKNIYLNYDFYEDIISHNIYEMIKDINCRCLIVHGDSDNTVPVEQSIKLKEVMGNNARLEIIKRANHQFDIPEQFEKSINLTIDFLKGNLLRRH